MGSQIIENPCFRKQANSRLVKSQPEKAVKIKDKLQDGDVVKYSLFMSVFSKHQAGYVLDAETEERELERDQLQQEGTAEAGSFYPPGKREKP